MKKIILFLFLILIFIFTLVNGKNLGTLKEVLKPESMEVDGDRVIITESATFYVYSIENLSLTAKFGKEGEGPGELKVVSMLPNTVKILEDRLFVDGMNKVIFFGKDFSFLKEIKKKYMTFKTIPVANNFVAMRIMPHQKNTYYFGVLLLDAEMNIMKELYKQEFRETDTDIDMVADSIHFSVYKDKIYIETSPRGFVIEVFDSEGKKLSVLQKEFKVIRITRADKQAILDNFREDNLVRMMVEREGGWKQFQNKMNFNFPANYPPIQDMMVVDDRIFVFTYQQKNSTRETIILDLHGKHLNTVYLPVPHESSFLTKTMGRDNRYYGISRNQYYYLKENHETEVWELFGTEIK